MPAVQTQRSEFRSPAPAWKVRGTWLKVCNPSSKEMERGSPQTKLASQTSRREEVQVEEEMLPQYIKCRATKEDT